MVKDKNLQFANVALALPLNRIFHYSIPDSMKKDASLGKRAWVEFGNRKKVGYIVGFSEEADVKKTKPLISVIDEEPIVSEKMLLICEAIGATIPSVLKDGKVSVKPRSHEEEGKEPTKKTSSLSLNKEQGVALTSVLERIDKEHYKVFLLHGITASGKTEIYLQAIEKVLKNGKTSIVLVPEIALTPQTVERFTSRFGDLVAVIHSALIGSMRYKEWKRIKDGEARIVVGARSAIFSPVKNLGLIIIDEEHETSYKQEDVPRYHARDVAITRARLSNCPIILGSATPSLESYYMALNKSIELVKLTKRIDDKNLPKVKIVDMRMELATRKKHIDSKYPECT